jgi:hypothetical protein
MSAKKKLLAFIAKIIYNLSVAGVRQRFSYLENTTYKTI